MTTQVAICHPVTKSSIIGHLVNAFSSFVCNNRKL